MDDMESILDELNCFEKRKTKEVTPLLEEYLARIAKTGDIIFPWSKLKPLMIYKMQQVMTEFRRDSPIEHIAQYPNVEKFAYDIMREKLLETVDAFTCAPFTIQRLCELVTTPRKHYKRTDKFMRGLEKNVLVVSTLEPHGGRGESSPDGLLVNGVLDSNNFNNHAADEEGDYSDRPNDYHHHHQMLIDVVENSSNGSVVPSLVDTSSSSSNIVPEREGASSPPVDVESNECDGGIDVIPDVPVLTEGAEATAASHDEESAAPSFVPAAVEVVESSPPGEAVAAAVSFPFEAALDEKGDYSRVQQGVVVSSDEYREPVAAVVEESGEVVQECGPIVEDEAREVEEAVVSAGIEIEQASVAPLPQEEDIAPSSETPVVVAAEESVVAASSEEEGSLGAGVVGEIVGAMTTEGIQMVLVESTSSDERVQDLVQPPQQQIEESMEASSEQESSLSSSSSSSSSVGGNSNSSGDLAESEADRSSESYVSSTEPMEQD